MDCEDDCILLYRYLWVKMLGLSFCGKIIEHCCVSVKNKDILFQVGAVPEFVLGRG
jgi:hypothetical protein